MIPKLNKRAIKDITRQLNESDIQYVQCLSDILNNIQEENQDMYAKGQDRDVVFILKIMAFADKLRVLHWSAESKSAHETIDELLSELEEYKDEVAENIQAIIGQFDPAQFKSLTLPIDNDPFQILDELRDCLNDWFGIHQDDIAYEGARSLTSDFLNSLYKSIYLLRLSKK